jgi:predicted regulator of Ras-like GTPase activity (Roadblock/LC7/MglB family)
VNAAVEKVLGALTRIDGVRGAMVADAEAGVPVQSRLATDVRETALAAMAGILFSRTDEASRAAGFAGLETVQLQAKGGHMVVAGAGPLLVVVLTEPDARLGLVRVQATRAARELSE